MMKITMSTVDQSATNTMSIDLTVTISVIIALCAIISPIIVSIINNHYQIKLKKIEINQINKAKIFEDYLCNLQRYIKYQTSDNKMKYGESYGKALVYASEETRKIMIELDRQMEGREGGILEALVNTDLEALIELINLDLKQ